MARKKAETCTETPAPQGADNARTYADALPGALEVSAEEVLTRTAYAKMRSLELSVKKEELALMDKAGELCKIDVALSAFDNFLKDYITLLRNFPDKVQSIVPQTTPDQYRELRNIVEDALQRFAAVRLHLTIESTQTEKKELAEADAVKRRGTLARRKESANVAD